MDNLKAFPNFIVREVPQLASTNLYAEELIATEKIAEGTVIVTPKQYAGIGHADNKWESEPYKNLTATIILNPTFLDASDQFYLTVVTSLSVANIIDQLIPGIATKIKWPNDIYCNHRKIAGILIKNHIMGSAIANSIIGLGLNINQTAFSNAPNATSFKLLTNKDYDVRQILSNWHDSIAHFYQMLKHDREYIMNLYLSRLYLKGQFANFLIGDRFIRASINGVDRHGMLVLYDEHRKKYTCGLKEIIFPVQG